MKITKFAFVALLALFTGCEEYFAEQDSKPDGSKPNISITAPANKRVFMKGQTIKIESLLSDKDIVKELDIQIVQLDESATGTPSNGSKAVWSLKKFPTKNPVVIDTSFAATDLPAGNYLLTLNGIDRRTNVGTKSVTFSVK